MTDPSALDNLLEELAQCEPSRRIDYRDLVLAAGSACIGPLTELAHREPELAASAAAWLETLVQRQPDARSAVIRALGTMARNQGNYIAEAALKRLGAAATPKRKVDGNGTTRRSAAEGEVHARIIQAAREGRILTYSELETSRGHVGKYLLNISRAEAEAGHPPLTALVVGKSNGRPGDGFVPAMIEIGFAERGETLDDVWHRAVAAVHAYWAEQSAGDG